MALGTSRVVSEGPSMKAMREVALKVEIVSVRVVVVPKLAGDVGDSASDSFDDVVSDFLPAEGGALERRVAKESHRQRLMGQSSL